MPILALIPAVIGLAGTASAADLGHRRALPPAPVLMAPAFTWTGLYVGGQLGYMWGKDITKEFLTFPYMFVGLQNRFNPDGIVGGVHAGANLQYGSLVLGAEIDADFGNVKGGFVDPPVAPFNPGGRGNTELGVHGSVRARLGYAMGQTLLYGTAGIAMGELKSTYYNWPGTGETFTRNIYGYTVGAGVEHALTNNITMRAEYRFTGYELLKNNSQIAFPGFTGTQEPRYHTTKVGVSYKF
jgi:outer membrane immunogenic protein